jgi:uncharacterized protein (TIGR00369 family)
MNRDHFRALEQLYLQDPINEFYRPTIEVEREAATIQIEVDPKYFHPAGAIHGSVTFKMLDDAAFFAASSLVEDVFVLTTSFTTYLTRPVSQGHLRSVGRVVNQNHSQIIAEAIAYDAEDREVGRGSGVFVRSKVELASISDYRQ